MSGTTAVESDAGQAYYRRPSPLASTVASSASSFSASSDPAIGPVADPNPAPPAPSYVTIDASWYPRMPRSLAGIALRSFGLGAALVFGILAGLLLVSLPSIPIKGLSPTFAATLSPLWRLPFFLAALSTFHFLEFWTTAAYNTPAATVDSFLLTANWPAYAIAHSAASVECILRYTLFRNATWFVTSAPWWPTRLLLGLGLVCTIMGQTVRTTAMVEAGRSFNHTIQHRRTQSHTLVTSGIYGWFRHPSYFGFFWWALGTQVVLGNMVCLAAYAAVLWRFFSTRIRHEEGLLVQFFGDAYVTYRERVGTKMPFI